MKTKPSTLKQELSKDMKKQGHVPKKKPSNKTLSSEKSLAEKPKKGAYREPNSTKLSSETSLQKSHKLVHVKEFNSFQNESKESDSSDEYVIINKTQLLKMREELEKGSPHWDGIYVSDYQIGKIDLIDAIISSQSIPLIPEIEKAFDAGRQYSSHYNEPPRIFFETVSKEDYISKLKLDI